MITQSLRCLRDENEVIHPFLTSHGKRVAGVVFDSIRFDSMRASVWRPRGIFFPVALSRAL